MAIVNLQYDYICNFRCEHCSIKRLQAKISKRKITVADVANLARQADEMGLARFVITGGEPLLFPDLDDLIAAIDPQKFFINLETNGWHFTEGKAEHLKNVGVDRVMFSVDNLDAEEHDHFRHRQGSFDRVMHAVDIAQAKGLNPFIQSVVTKQRLHSQEFIEFLEYFNSKGISVWGNQAKPVGAWEGNYDILFDKEDMTYIEELGKHHRVFTHLTPSYGLDMGCIAVKGMFTVTHFGDVLPCPFIQISIGNILDEPLKDIIQRGLDIKFFGEYVDTCLIGEDRNFIYNYMDKKVFGHNLPVPWDQVFTDADKTETRFNDAVKK
jgi:MoaA/NifB/PqqE/SkfB family radical SAM enzyme